MKKERCSKLRNYKLYIKKGGQEKDLEGEEWGRNQTEGFEII